MRKKTISDAVAARRKANKETRKKAKPKPPPPKPEVKK